MDQLLQECGRLYANPFTLVDISQENQPLIFVNQAFLDLTQYRPEEVIGKNCRFLQGKLTDRMAATRIRNAISAREPICENLLNYKKDGTPFCNRLVLLPFKTQAKWYFFGLQHDLTSKTSECKPFSQTIKSGEISDWIRNRMTPVILNIEHMGETRDQELTLKISQALNRISEYILGLD